MTTYKVRMERWRFTSVLGACGMFLKGTAHLGGNKHVTREIVEQHERACLEVEKLSLLIKDRFK